MTMTIREALGNKDSLPPELVAQAKNLYEATLVYTGHAERAVAGIVRDMGALTLTRDEAHEAIGKILDIKDSVEEKAEAAFSTLSKDFDLPKAEEAKPPSPTPTPSLPANPGPTTGTKDLLEGLKGDGNGNSTGISTGTANAPAPGPLGGTSDAAKPGLTQQEIADSIKAKLAADGVKPAANSNTATENEAQTGLAAPATLPAGADMSKNVV